MIISHARLNCAEKVVSLYEKVRKTSCREEDNGISSRTIDFFSHRIERGSVEKGVQYSLTFRSVSWKNRNSTCIIGDSNTGHLAFATKRLQIGRIDYLRNWSRIWILPKSYKDNSDSQKTQKTMLKQKTYSAFLTTLK